MRKLTFPSKGFARLFRWRKVTRAQYLPTTWSEEDTSCLCLIFHLRLHPLTWDGLKDIEKDILGERREFCELLREINRVCLKRKKSWFGKSKTYCFQGHWPWACLCCLPPLIFLLCSCRRDAPLVLLDSHLHMAPLTGIGHHYQFLKHGGTAGRHGLPAAAPPSRLWSIGQSPQYRRFLKVGQILPSLGPGRIGPPEASEASTWPALSQTPLRLFLLNFQKTHAGSLLGQRQQLRPNCLYSSLEQARMCEEVKKKQWWCCNGVAVFMLLFFATSNFRCIEIQPDVSSMGVWVTSTQDMGESSVVLPSPVSLLRDWLRVRRAGKVQKRTNNAKNIECCSNPK